MTFLEAAIEVLRQEGRPLHYREITKLAIERDYLSHIGKMPDQAMQTRLSSAVRRRDPGARLVKVGPGTFFIEGSDQSTTPAPPQQLEESSAGATPLDRAAGAPASPSCAPEESPDQDLSGDATEPEAAPEPFPAQDQGLIEPSSRARKRRKRRRRAKGADGAGDLLTTLAQLVEAVGRPIQLADLAAAARARGLVAGEARHVEETLVSILRADVELQTRRGLRPRLAIEGDRVDLLDRVVGAETLDLEQRILASTEQLARRARARVTAEIQRIPLASVAAIVRVCLSAAGRGDARLVNVVSDREVRLECFPVDGGSSLSVVVLKAEGDASEEVERCLAEATRSGRLSPAAPLLVVTTGLAQAAARNGGGAPHAEIWDAQELAARMELVGLGYRATSVSLVSFDVEFFGRLCP